MLTSPLLPTSEENRGIFVKFNTFYEIWLILSFMPTRESTAPCAILHEMCTISAVIIYIFFW